MPDYRKFVLITDLKALGGDGKVDGLCGIDAEARATEEVANWLEQRIS